MDLRQSIDARRIWDAIYRSKGHIWIKPNKSILELNNYMNSSENEPLLDLGSGNGRHIIHFSKKGIEVTGIDISKMAIRLSEAWAKREGLDDTIHLNCDMQSIPFPKNYFKAIISTNAIHHNDINSIKSTVNEMHRVLDKNGIAMVTVASTNNYKFGQGEKIEKNTFIPHIGTDAGLTHHFFDRKELTQLFGKKFNILYQKEVDQAEPVGGGVYWHLLARKK